MRVFLMGLTIVSAAFAGTSFNKDVAPILQKACQDCHRPGMMAPMSLLSFEDARPRGVSGMHFEETDTWTVGDMVRHLQFEKGELHFYADYVRGRCMKTTIIIRADGTFTLDTVNRGEAMTRWIAKLQGKKILSAVADADE